MIRTILFASGFFLFSTLIAQNKQNQNITTYENGVTFIKCSSFSVSKPMSEWADAETMTSFNETSDLHERRKLPLITNPDAINEDGSLQTNMGTRAPAATLKNWQGQSGSGCPPDPTGAASLTQYVQAVNSTYRVYNKTTGAPLASAKSLNSLWPTANGDGDPVVLYDKAADRWFVSQFQVLDGTNALLLAVSTTNNATGTYYTYSFIPNANDQPDYPKYAIWSDGYYMTCNYGTQRVVVFDRTKMLAGDPNAGMIVKTLPTPIRNNFFCPLAGDASDSQLPPPSTTYCPIFSYEDDSWGAPADRIKIWKMHVDFTTPSNTTIAVDQTLNTSPFDAASFDPNWYDITQPGTTQKIDAIAGVLNYRAQYRRWTGYNTITICHAVKINTSPGQVGVRWYELRQDQTSNVWSIHQQGTLAQGTLSRWCGSIGMDDNGSIGLAYSACGSTAPDYLSLRYTGRLSTDPLNTMTFAEQTAITSSSSLTNCDSRDGDYTQLMLDPDGLTFWHTGEYCASNNPVTRIYSFQLNATNGITENTNKTELKAYQVDTHLKVDVSQLLSNDELSVDLFDITGKQITGKKIKPTSNSFETTIDVSALSSGVYLVRIGNVQFQRVVKINITR
jgi:hypothetical protein